MFLAFWATFSCKNLFLKLIYSNISTRSVCFLFFSGMAQYCYRLYNFFYSTTVYTIYFVYTRFYRYSYYIF